MNNEKHEAVLAKVIKLMSEQLDREYFERVMDEHRVKLFLSGGTTGWAEYSTNYPDPRTVTTYIYGGTKGIATYTSTTEFIYNEPEKKIADPKLQRVLERNYELARCRHDVKQMRRLEKQMHANYK